MLYRSYAPSAPLRDSVTFWSLTDTPAHTRERIVPSGTLELVINLDDAQFRIYDSLEPETFARFSGAIVSGAFQRPFVIDTRDHASIIGVHFTPGAAFAMLGVPPGGLIELAIDDSPRAMLNARRIR